MIVIRRVVRGELERMAHTLSTVLSIQIHEANVIISRGLLC